MAFDYEKQKLIKDKRRFDFDRTIYLDLFLNENRDKAKAHRKELDRLHNALKQLRQVLDSYTK